MKGGYELINIKLGMQFSIITIFPNFFKSFLCESLLAKAIAKKKIKINVFDLRDFARDKHKTVDDSPYGGGPGMVMKVDMWFRALETIVGKQELTRRYQKSKKARKQESKTRIILLDPAGEQFTQNEAQNYADKVDHLVLCCGRYEGFDHRITKLADERLSIGPYVLNGGEVAAQVITEAVFRLVPGAIGNPESLNEESFSNKNIGNWKLEIGNYVEYPQYTRPENFSPAKKINWRVPRVLLSGDHKKIKNWRKNKTRKQ